MKRKLLYFAMILLILCLPFRGNEAAVRWLWENLIWIPVFLVFISLTCIGIYLFKTEKISKEKVG